MSPVKTQKYYSRGKLMITGEYLVLRGSKSLALPLTRGQELIVRTQSGRASLGWKTYVEGNYWFEANFSLPELAIANTNDFPIAQNIRDILIVARELNPDFLPGDKQVEVRSLVEFNINWGFGSSSSLLNNVAQWAGVNPFDIHFRVSEGSGYDIAAAKANAALVYSVKYKNPEFTTVDFYPEFQSRIFFAYLGGKQNSAEAVSNFSRIEKSLDKEVHQIDEITHSILKANSVSEFISLLRNHDKVLSSVLDIRPVSELRFPDFNGYVKSLGAWGGDFAMFVSDMPREYVLGYFRQKELKNWFSFNDLILSPNHE